MKRLILVLAFALVGCGDGTTAPSVASMVGTWLLQTVNGVPMPISSGTFTSTSETFVFAANNTFTYNYAWTQAGVSGTQTDSEPGVWSLSGSTVSLTFSEGGSATGLVTGSTLTVNAADDDDVYVFKKQ